MARPARSPAPTTAVADTDEPDSERPSSHPLRTTPGVDPKLVVWVRAGGRCTLCHDYLLESKLTYKLVPLGELAHNVGRKDSPRSPRGQGSELTENERDAPENLLLACESCHGDIDKLINTGEITVEYLRERKRQWEAFIRHVTGLAPEAKTVVLRVHGRIRGTTIDLRREEAAAAVLRAGTHHPSFLPSTDAQGIEIDLRGIAGEMEAGPAYYEQAAAKIDEEFRTRIRPYAEQEGIPHLSVFAFTRLPLLVYLGARIDDTINADIHDRHRETGAWSWLGDGAADVDFAHQTDVDAGTDEAVLVVNASGTIHAHELPAGIEGLTRFVIGPVGTDPAVGTVRTAATRWAFEECLRHLIAHIEAEHKQIRRIHLFAAAPISVAVTIGKAFGWGIHPPVLIYDRNDGVYVPVLEIPR